MTIDIPHMIATLVVIFAVLWLLQRSGKLAGASRGKRFLLTFVVLFAVLMLLNLLWPSNLTGAEKAEAPLAATVLGEEVYTDDAAEMQDIVLTRLFDDYARDQGIEVTDAEIDAFVDNLQRGMRARGLTAEDDLTPEEAAQAERMRRNMARSIIQHWKLNRALYQQYGGRIIFQQLGPEPLDAYRQFLEEHQAAGDFSIRDKALEADFWRYFTDDSLHDFYPPGSEEEAKAFETPPWQSTAATSALE